MAGLAFLIDAGAVANQLVSYASGDIQNWSRSLPPCIIEFRGDEIANYRTVQVLTFDPFIDWVRLGAWQTGVGIFPVYLHSVLLVDKHRVSDATGRSPTVASNSAMAIQIVKFALVFP